MALFNDPGVSRPSPAASWEEAEAGPVMPARAQPRVSSSSSSWALRAALGAAGLSGQRALQLLTHRKPLVAVSFPPARRRRGPRETRGGTPGRAARRFRFRLSGRLPGPGSLCSALPSRRPSPGGLSSCPSLLPQASLSGQHPGPAGPPHGPCSPTEVPGGLVA